MSKAVLQVSPLLAEERWAVTVHAEAPPSVFEASPLPACAGARLVHATNAATAMAIPTYAGAKRTRRLSRRGTFSYEWVTREPSAVQRESILACPAAPVASNSRRTREPHTTPVLRLCVSSRSTMPADPADVVLRFLESVGRPEEARFYLERFRAEP